jgi:Cu-Zn family superoxide dismutase
MVRIALTLAAATLAAACTSMTQDKPSSPGTTAMAKLEPTKGNTAAGSAMFTQRGDMVTVTVNVSGLKPNGDHGFHVHEKGDCSSGDGMSTGGHFNPLAKPHAAHGAAEHHAGDLPSLKADATGSVDVKVMLHGVTLKEGPTAVVGRSLIVHAQPDDYKTQPTGNSGVRLACGVIVARS